MHYEIWKKNDDGTMVAFNPVQNKGNKAEHIVDPQLWVDSSCTEDKSSPVLNKSEESLWNRFKNLFKKSEVTKSSQTEYNVYKVNKKRTPLAFYSTSTGKDRVSKEERNIPKGAVVFGTGKIDGARSEVKTISGRTGWVNSKYLKKDQ